MSLSVVAAEQYQKLWDTAFVDPFHLKQAMQNAQTIIEHSDRYSKVSAFFHSMPMYLVGLIHMMESSFNWNCHLYNGDPLTARTVHVPVGQPSTGTPPFTWEESAEGSLSFHGASVAAFDTIPQQLHFLESYNGFGYRKHGINTPYLWSGTNQYISGKYVQDGHFDPNAKSEQIGCVATLKVLLQVDPQLKTQIKS